MLYPAEPRQVKNVPWWQTLNSHFPQKVKLRREKWKKLEISITCSDLKLPLSSTNTGEKRQSKAKEKVGEEEEESQNKTSVGSPKKLWSPSQAVNSQESCTQQHGPDHFWGGGHWSGNVFIFPDVHFLRTWVASLTFLKRSQC